jgi:transposase
MKKTSTVRVNRNMIFKGHKLTIGLDLGDRWSFYCVLDEAGEVLLEQKVATTPEAMKQTFEKIPRSLIALETGTHSPWVSRLLRELGHQVLVAHAQKVQLISKSNRKDDRHDARTLARLARIDPELLGPVRHRSAKAQIHLTVIRARAELVRARTSLVNAARGLAKSYDIRASVLAGLIACEENCSSCFLGVSLKHINLIGACSFSQCILRRMFRVFR